MKLKGFENHQRMTRKKLIKILYYEQIIVKNVQLYLIRFDGTNEVNIINYNFSQKSRSSKIFCFYLELLFLCDLCELVKG
jgi:hypothetical protein